MRCVVEGGCNIFFSVLTGRGGWGCNISVLTEGRWTAISSFTGDGMMACFTGGEGVGIGGGVILFTACSCGLDDTRETIGDGEGREGSESVVDKKGDAG